MQPQTLKLLRLLQDKECAVTSLLGSLALISGAVKQCSDVGQPAPPARSSKDVSWHTELRAAQSDLLIQWLSLNMKEKVADVTCYLEDLDSHAWQRAQETDWSGQCLSLLPPDCDPMYRAHFLCDVGLTFSLALATQ